MKRWRSIDGGRVGENVEENGSVVYGVILLLMIHRINNTKKYLSFRVTIYRPAFTFKLLICIPWC